MFAAKNSYGQYFQRKKLFNLLCVQLFTKPKFDSKYYYVYLDTDNFFLQYDFVTSSAVAVQQHTKNINQVVCSQDDYIVSLQSTKNSTEFRRNLNYTKLDPRITKTDIGVQNPDIKSCGIGIKRYIQMRDLAIKHLKY